MNPIKTIVNLKQRELPFVGLMFFYFFFVIAAYSILKILKKGLFVEFYDSGGLFIWGNYLRASQIELLAKVGNVAVAVIAMAVFSILSTRFKKGKLAVLLAVFFAGCNVFFYFFLATQSELSVWAFYWFGDFFNMMMVVGFFAFLNHVVKPFQAERLYGIIILGGVSGGVFGAVFLKLWIAKFPLGFWLIASGIGCSLIGLCAIGAQKSSVFLGKNLDKGKTAQANPTEKNPIHIKTVIDGARTTIKSNYLLSIVAIVGLYEICSNLVDFQFTETVAQSLDKTDIRQYFSTIYMFVNIVAFTVQLLATSFVMTRFKVKTALLILPSILLIGSLGFLGFPLLLFASFLCIADNGLHYSIDQSAKEVLYVPLGTTEKYRAKAFIDMFVHRFAKVLGIGTTLVLSIFFIKYFTVRWLSAITLLIIIFWLFIAKFAGKKYELLAQAKKPEKFSYEPEEKKEEQTAHC